MLFPMFLTRKTESREDNIDPQTGEKDILTRFRVGTVFDISQTNPADAEPCERCVSGENERKRGNEK